MPFKQWGLVIQRTKVDFTGHFTGIWRATMEVAMQMQNDTKSVVEMQMHA